ncbi:uncharacterized protein LOC133644908 [Entelurus aequoreus]|uniref:uncharacterized protein LOC133644908 n=1 Tax=Entelurus aequoreus TaxID=161455 RepID=UPI002B1DF8CC|nr:uncharacterized protein LOC133644908 [Entelurus aequoreus]
MNQLEKSDTAIYYCLRIHLGNWMFLNGIFLQVTEPEPFVSVFSEVQPGPPVKLQCSVLSHSGNETCQDGPKVSWFRTGPGSVHPSFVFTHDECKKIKDNSTQNCFHTFSKTLSSSDAGIYMCALVTCGRIFMGNPVEVIIKGLPRDLFWSVLSVALALSFIMSAFLIHKIRTTKCCCCKAGPQILDETSSCIQQRDEDSLVYTVPTIVTRKTAKARQTKEKAAEEMTTYADVCFRN